MTQDHAYQQLVAGDYPQAIQLYQHLIEAEPAVKTPYWYLGLALLLQGEEAEAQATWMLAMVDGEPEQVEQWTTELAAILQTEADRQTGLQDWAIAWAIRQYIRELHPEDLVNLLHLVDLGIKLRTLTPDALAELEIVSVLQSERSVDPVFLLQVLQGLLSLMPVEPIVADMAEACLPRIPEPIDYVRLLMDTAIDVAHGMGKPLQAVRYAQLCLQIYPDNLDLMQHLCYFYQNADQHQQAIETARQLCLMVRALPDQVFAAFLLMRSLMRAGGYWQEIFPIFDHQQTLIEQLAATQTEPLDQSTVFRLATSTFFQPYIRDDLANNRLTQNRVFQLCQSSVQVYMQERADRYRQGIAQRRHDRPSTRPLRIGYVSHCLKRHSVGWLCRWLFQYHDRQQFQIYGYFWNYQPQANDELQQWFFDHVDQVRTFKRHSGEIADRIFADQIDILIDLDSITADIGCEVLALKPAPIQATWLGWDASGIPAVDYFLVDSYVVPEWADAHYSEKLWRLPQTYIAVDGFEVGVPTLRREDLGIPKDAIVYWSGQSSYKRHPDMVRSQLQIIKAVPNSYLLVKGLTGEQSIQNYFLQMAQEEGVDPDRLRFLPDVRLEMVHRANLAIADVVLDTYPYNGATTTLETLWMGIPLVTRVGEHFSSRNSYTMMINAGIEEGIAWSAAEYVEWGVRLGTDPALRQQIAWKLWRSRQTSPLWNAQQFTHDMETAYRQMWSAYLEQDSSRGLQAHL
ncbi:O-linked N-acetylglucosamine transferase, SPINDLY family protein [Pantanalinema rosaneae CENA516]|uniref:O-linked N-acetylglucosamine transferase, SPINDLY family protein n=1 Tax=Pantanalinema rosaneae TaxID=1620701 RepID=UPI003D6F5F73